MKGGKGEGQGGRTLMITVPPADSRAESEGDVGESTFAV